MFKKQTPALTKSQKRLLKQNLESYSDDFLLFLLTIYESNGEKTMTWTNAPKAASAAYWRVIQMKRIARTLVKVGHLIGKAAGDEERYIAKALSALRMKISHTYHPDGTQDSHLHITIGGRGVRMPTQEQAGRFAPKEQA